MMLIDPQKVHQHTEIMWRCDVCDTERANRFISLRCKRGLDRRGNELQVNIKYCNDKTTCKEQAEHHKLFDLLVEITEIC